MKNNFVPFEIAKELRELGFDEPCFGYYGEANELRLERFVDKDKDLLKAPLWQQVFRWFIEKYQLNGVPYYNFVGKWDYNIQRVEAGLLSGSVTAYIAMRDTYPEIQEACINRLISIVKERKNENKDSH